MKMRFWNFWDKETWFNYGHIAIFNVSWQFDNYWKGIRIVIFNFGVEIGVNNV